MVLFFFFAQNTGNYFPEQGWNLSPLHWKWKVLNNGSPGNSPWAVRNRADKINFKNCSKGVWVFCLFYLFIYLFFKFYLFILFYLQNSLNFMVKIILWRIFRLAIKLKIITFSPPS